MKTDPLDIPGFPARRAALRLNDAVLRRGETLDTAAHGATQGLTPADRALARALAGEVLRWMVYLDALIDSATRLPLAGDAKARAVLRLMLAGWLRLDTPPHAVIATGLELLSGGPRRLAHGVFSALVRAEAKLPDAPTLPDDVAERWVADGCLARLEAIAAALALPPAVDLTLKDPAATAHWTETLGGISLAPGHVRLARGGAVESLAGFDEGAWWVQDLAASLPARLLGAGEGHMFARGRALDLCAAPGGKSMQLAAAGWSVTALDAHERRLQVLRANMQRVGLSADVVCADVLEWQPEGQFDAILLDAPCTATGTCRRHPDVLHRIRPRHIAEMADIQAALLARAAGWLAPGGRLVYAVCSMEAAEGEAQAARFSAASGLAADPIRADELPAGLTPTPEGWLRTDPGMLADHGGIDGFFVARWVKV